MGRAAGSGAPSGVRRRGWAPATALLLAVAVVAASFVVGLAWLRGTFASDGPPECDRPATVLSWIERDRQWRRTEAFQLVEAVTVQVDVRIHSDGAVLDFGESVHAVPAGTPFPAPATDGDESTDDSFDGWVLIGHGREAVNEQVDLGAGEWELVVGGSAGPVEVRWPC